MASVTYDKASRIYPGSERPAVDALDLHIDDGEFLVLVGPSGCGKSTSLRMLAGLEDVDRGDILIGDRQVTNLKSKDRDIAMVFQSYALYPHMTVGDNMGFALKIAGKSKEEIATRVKEAAKILDLEEFLDRKPKALSGGQRQRVAMGRAIVRSPQVFLMDEPLSNLDAKLRVQTRTQIAALQRRLATTTVYVTHDQVEAMTMGDRVAVLRAGILEQCDTPLRLYQEPANVFVAGFIGSPGMNIAEFRIEDGHAVLGRARIPLTARGLDRAGRRGRRPRHRRFPPGVDRPRLRERGGGLPGGRGRRGGTRFRRVPARDAARAAGGCLDRDRTDHRPRAIRAARRPRGSRCTCGSSPARSISSRRRPDCACPPEPGPGCAPRGIRIRPALPPRRRTTDAAAERDVVAVPPVLGADADVRPVPGAAGDRAPGGGRVPPVAPGDVRRPAPGAGAGAGLGDLRRRRAAVRPPDGGGDGGPGRPLHARGQALRRHPRGPGRGVDRGVPARAGRPGGGHREDGGRVDADRVADGHRGRLQHLARDRGLRRDEPRRRRTTCEPGAAPRTSFGLVTEALVRRRDRGLAPFTVVSCDNIQHNGDVARRSFSRLRRAARRGPRRLGRAGGVLPELDGRPDHPRHHGRGPGRGRPADSASTTSGRWCASRSPSGCSRTASASAGRPWRTPASRSSTTSSRTS